MGQNLFIGDSIGELNPCPQGWIWIRPIATGVEIYSIDEGTPVLLAVVSLNSHSHPTHGDIDFTGSVSSGGEVGIDSPGDGEYEVGQIESIKVRNGLIVGFTEK